MYEMGPVQVSSCSREEAVVVERDFGPDGLQVPARGRDLHRLCSGFERSAAHYPPLRTDCS